jgi:F-type H+-transporting ATPase subunit gamma
MGSLRTIRTRIRSVRNTQKITKAMKMVAAAKLRRAQDAVVRARPYAQLIDEMLASLVRSPEEVEQAPHPLMHVRPVRRVEVLLMTSDRGLCGGFNANVIRRGQRFLVEEGAQLERVQFSTVGRRGRDFARKRNIPTRKDYVGFFGKLGFWQAKQIADDLIHSFLNDELDAVYLLYNEFKSAIAQQISLKQLLPIVPKALDPEKAKPDPKGLLPAPHLYEPSRPEVLRDLLPRHLAMQVWRALLESEASEHGARMTAMDAATKNASEMIGRLTLEYNRARQAAITKELMEIVSGAEALK